MKDIVKQMLAPYNCQSLEDFENALKEIIQEIALLGMWRGKFFEKGAFYGGTALRILYSLPRFSEDLDFSLLKSDRAFDISKYEPYIIAELNSFGFEVEIEKKEKTKITNIDSAFIKANSLVHLIKVNAEIKTQKNRLLKIKLEVDKDPPQGFKTEVLQHFIPIPFSVKTFSLPSLFAGKISALLFRPYKQNLKGRDWYDYLWYISRGVPIDLRHLQKRIEQVGKWQSAEELSLEKVKKLLQDKFQSSDINLAKNDVLPFVRNKTDLDAWSEELFLKSTEQLIAN